MNNRLLDTNNGELSPKSARLKSTFLELCDRKSIDFRTEYFRVGLQYPTKVGYVNLKSDLDIGYFIASRGVDGQNPSTHSISIVSKEG